MVRKKVISTPKKIIKDRKDFLKELAEEHKYFKKYE